MSAKPVTLPSRSIDPLDLRDLQAARGRRLHDLHDAGAARQLRADRTFRRALGLYAVQRRHASRRSGPRRAALRLSASQASVLRQVHAGRGPLRPDLLRAVDGHGRSARPEVRSHGRSPLLRRPRARDAVGRRARLPARRRRPRDAAQRQRPRRSSAVRPGQGPRDPRAVRPHRIHRRHERRQRRPVGRRPRDRCRQSRLLGLPRRRHRLAEDRRLRRRVRDVRRARSGAEDAGDGRAGRQAAAHLLLRQQRRHRRRADRRRGAEQVRRRLRAARSVDVVRLERLHARRTATTTRRSSAC